MKVESKAIHEFVITLSQAEAELLEYALELLDWSVLDNGGSAIDVVSELFEALPRNESLRGKDGR